MSLYLSRLILNARSRQVINEMTHPYEMHRTLMRAFPKATDDTESKARDEFGVLFRAELDGHRGLVKIYVQSLVEPNWSFLDELHDYLGADTDRPAYECKDIMPACRKIQNGQIFSFRLRANPTKRVGKRDDTMKGKRVELRREDEQIAWLIRKGQAKGTDVTGGFDLFMKKAKGAKGAEKLVPYVNVCCVGKQTGRKKDAGFEQKTTHLAVLFDGLLQVTDVKAFIATIVCGIGTGKAFGFGLLSIAPANISGADFEGAS